ncbi:MAG TPA: cytochrome c biogenesis protein DipZ [Dokdonella sp.]
MSLVVLCYLAGALTILSPCILPVLPFVFARSQGTFGRDGLPMLAGMAITFALVASLAALGGGWAVHANEYGRYAALALLAAFGVTLLVPRWGDLLARPLVTAGARLAGGRGEAQSPLSSFVLGVATGLLWAPCAGPILGLVLTGAALEGASAGTSLMLLAYAAGAATSLAIALRVGGRAFAAMKRSLGAGEWIRRALGAAVLASVVAIALGLDTRVLAQLSFATTNRIEQALLSLAPGARAANRDASATVPPPSAPGALGDEGAMPSLAGATAWLNSPPLTGADLRGKVVLIDFWTYSCVNCIRTLPYLRAWYDKYRADGFVVVGVHAPEFAFERDAGNVRAALARFGIDYPVALDDDFAIWRAFGNQFWPAHYFVDARGRVRHRSVGEGGYAESEALIRTLLAEAGRPVDAAPARVDADGVARAASDGAALSPETYVGYSRARGFAARDELAPNRPHAYAPPDTLAPDAWSLAGTWTVAADKAVLAGAHGTLSYRFRARDVNVVLGPGAAGAKIPFRVLVDGRPPGDDHGVDVDADGVGTLGEQRMYQLVRLRGGAQDHRIDVEFGADGAEVYALTFG